MNQDVPWDLMIEPEEYDEDEEEEEYYEIDEDDEETKKTIDSYIG